MTPLLAMVRANLKMSLRNRAALFWNLAFPALFIVKHGRPVATIAHIPVTFRIY